MDIVAVVGMYLREQDMVGLCKALWVMAYSASGQRMFWCEGTCPQWGVGMVWGSTLVNRERLASLQRQAEWLLSGFSEAQGATRFLRLHDAPPVVLEDRRPDNVWDTWEAGGDQGRLVDVAQAIGVPYQEDTFRGIWAVREGQPVLLSASAGCHVCGSVQRGEGWECPDCGTV